MEQTRYYCDHCGKQLDLKIDYDDITIDIGHRWYSTDLCSDCMNKLCDIVDRYINTQEGERNKNI